jgi:hypothetical protein
MAKYNIVIELEASQVEAEELVSRLQTLVAGQDLRANIEVSPRAGWSPTPDKDLIRAVVEVGMIFDTSAAERAEFARGVQPGALIAWWDDDLGFFESRVTRVREEKGLRSFEVEGRDARVSEDDLYRPLTVHDAQLWDVQPGDELEWCCPTTAERSTSDTTTPRCCDLGVTDFPGGFWHHARVERVFHKAFTAPCFEVLGCAQVLGEPSFRIRVPVGPVVGLIPVD